MVYLGTFNSGAAQLSIPILCRSNLAMVSPANTYPGLTKPGKGEADEPDKFYPQCKRNYARVIPADDLQGVAGANWAKQAGAQRVYVLDEFLRPVPPGESKSRETRYLDIREDDDLDEAQLGRWIRQAAALPGWSP